MEEGAETAAAWWIKLVKLHSPPPAHFSVPAEKICGRQGKENL